MVAAPPRSYAEAVIAAGDRWLPDLAPAIEAADPEGRVTTSSRLLCAGLGELASLTLRALSHGWHGRRAEEVGRAAAMLSLLTKIDDQIIDDPAFHGGDRKSLVRRTRGYLAPTLASIRSGHPANAEPRCALAADVGRALRALAADEARLDRMLATVSAGWEVQVESVRVLTSPPSAVTREEVAAVTRSISGVWLLMIARVGELPAEAGRAISPDEERAFYAFGWAIQRADALADLAKDVADGHLSSWPGLLLWERAPEAYLDAALRGDAAAIYRLLHDHGVDIACLADAAERASLAAALPDLGEVPALLAWVHDFLSRRYAASPLSRVGGTDRPPARLWSGASPPEDTSCSAR